MLKLAMIALLVITYDLAGAALATGAEVSRGCRPCPPLGPRAARLAQVFADADQAPVRDPNRDILIRTAALIAAWLLFPSSAGRAAGDVVLAANSVLHNLAVAWCLFLDGFCVGGRRIVRPWP